jgi:hypothetical protein
MLINHAIPDTPSRLIPVVRRGEQRPVETRAKVPNSGALYGGLGTREL